MTLRQKVIVVSKTDPCPIGSATVEKKFKTSLVSGLRSQSIRAQVRELLKNPFVTDEELLESLSLIESEETEYSQKFNKNYKPVLSSAVSCSQSIPEQTNGKQEKSKLVLEELSDVKMQLCELKALFGKPSSFHDSSKKNAYRSEIHNGQFQTSKRGSRRNLRRRCDNCEVQNKDGQCTHCFLCGSTEHFRAGCKQKNV